MDAPMNLTKPDVAIRQIETAIELFAHERDPVSIYTLAMAAFNILRDLSQHHGASTILEEATEWVRPDMRTKFWAEFRRPANFMKHADRDPDGELKDFNPKVNELLLFLCSMLIFERGHGERTRPVMFIIWFTVVHPEYLKEPTEETARSELRAKLKEAEELMQRHLTGDAMDILRMALRLYAPAVSPTYPP